MKRSFCQCGHVLECHGGDDGGEWCVGCDCNGFTLKKIQRAKKLRVSTFVRKLEKKMDMNRRNHA